MAFTNTLRLPADLPDQTLHTTTALDLLTGIADRLGENDF